MVSRLQCGPQNLNTKGMHTSWCLFYSIKNAIMVGCLVVFEGMKAVSSPVQRVLRLFWRVLFPSNRPGDFAGCHIVGSVYLISATLERVAEPRYWIRLCKGH